MYIASLAIHAVLAIILLFGSDFFKQERKPEKEKKAIIATLYQAPAKKVKPLPKMTTQTHETDHSEKPINDAYNVSEIKIPSHSEQSETALPMPMLQSDVLSPLSAAKNIQHNSSLVQNPVETQSDSLKEIQHDLEKRKKRLQMEQKISMDWIAMFPSTVAERIQKELPAHILSQRVTCTVHIQLTQDGTLLSANALKGDDILCDEAIRILNRIVRFEIPQLIPEHAAHLKDLTVKIGPWFID